MSSSLKSTGRQDNTSSVAPWQQERAVSKLMPEVCRLDRLLVRRCDQVRTGDCLEKQQVRGARIVPTGDQAVGPRTGRSGPSTRFVHPRAVCTRPPVVAADSRARVAVVPTEITRPPVACVRFTNRAVVSGMSNGSAIGGSPDSAEETPAWRVIGAIVMPDATRRVTSSVLKGRAALAISALPKWRANTAGSR